MGYNAREEAVLVTLDALEKVLRTSGGVEAAQEVYAS
jgi:aspartate aminotransferase-like enzyme